MGKPNRKLRESSDNDLSINSDKTDFSESEDEGTFSNGTFKELDKLNELLDYAEYAK